MNFYYSALLVAISTIASSFPTRTLALQSNAPQSLTETLCDSRTDGRTLCDVQLDVPSACVVSAASSCPIVFFLHGAGGGNGGTANRSGVHDETVIGVYPQGEKGWNTGPKNTNLCHWSDYSCTSDPDEGDFIASIIAELRTMGANGNIYVIGSSNGAALAHRLAANAGSDLPIKGIVAKVTQLLESPERSGPGVLNYNQPSLSGDRITPPVSVLSVLGTEDGLIPYEGGSSSVFGGDDSFQLMSALDSMEFWATHNGCSGSNNPVISNKGSDMGTGNVIKYEYTGCPDDIVVEHYAVEGGGHNSGGVTIDGESVGDIAYDFIRRVENTLPPVAAPVVAPVAAPVSSPTPQSCSNDPNWAGKFNPDHTCDFVAQNPDGRCFFEDTSGVTANEACPEACDTDCAENPVSSPTQAPTQKVCPRVEKPNQKFTLKSNDKEFTCTKVASRALKNRTKLCKKNIITWNGNKRKLHQKCPITCGNIGIGQCKFLADQ